MDKLILLQSFSNYVEANIVLGRLQSDGVDCCLQDENDPYLGVAIRGIKLVVPQSQFESAKKLLEEYFKE
jgi:hypothetical protein